MSEIRVRGVRFTTMTSAGSAIANAAAMLADIQSGQKVFIPPGTYQLDAVVIPNGARVDIEGDNAVLDLKTGDGGFQIADAATLERARFSDLKFIGDGTTTVATQGAIWSNSGPTVKGIYVERCWFENLPFGVQICHASAGNVDNAVIERCRFVNMVGTGSGTGLGVALLGRAGFPLHATLRENYFYRCNRHSIYVSAGGSVDLIGNKIYQHRNGQSQSNFAGMALSRCQHVRVIGGEFWGCTDTAMRIDNDAGVGVRSVSVSGVDFNDNTYVDLWIGTDSPNANGVLRGVSITGNKIYKASNQNPMIYVDSAQGLIIQNNTLVQDETGGAQTNSGLMRINGAGTSTSASRNYIISGNTMDLNITGATRRAIDVGSTVAAGTGRFDLGPNSVNNATDEIYVGGALSNTDMMINGLIRYAGDPTSTITPRFAGQRCIDTTNSAEYVAITGSSSSWKKTTP